MTTKPRTLTSQASRTMRYTSLPRIEESSDCEYTASYYVPCLTPHLDELQKYAIYRPKTFRERYGAGTYEELKSSNERRENT
jgi:hypothetical protein